MSDSHVAPHAVTAPFSDTEIQAFQASDIHAGTVIILLMTAIFSIGFLMYGAIAVIVG